VLFRSRDRATIRVSIRFSDWLVSGYAHAFVLLSVVIVTLPKLKCEISIMLLLLGIKYSMRDVVNCCA